MTRRTEEAEQEFIDAWLEEERQPNHPEPQLGRAALHDLEFCDMGTYLERE